MKSTVRLGNNAAMEVEAKGNIAVQTKQGTKVVNEVLLVPNLKNNLLSVGQMMEKWYVLYMIKRIITRRLQ